MDTTVISEIADFSRAIGEPVDRRLPFVGENFNVTRAGIHADGLIKDEEISTRSIRRGRCIGRLRWRLRTRAGLLMWMRRHRPATAEGLDKRDGRLLRVLELVMAEYDEGRVTSLSDEEVGALVDAAWRGGE